MRGERTDQDRTDRRGLELSDVSAQRSAVVSRCCVAAAVQVLLCRVVVWLLLVRSFFESSPHSTTPSRLVHITLNSTSYVTASITLTAPVGLWNTIRLPSHLLVADSLLGCFLTPPAAAHLPLSPMISLKSLMAAEEGRAASASPTTAKADDLGSWLSDYNKSKGGITGAVQGASSSVSNLFSSFTSSSASASSPSALSTSSNPDVAPASSYSSWFTFTPSSSSSETTSLTASTPTSVSSWMSAIPGYGEDSNVCFGLSWHQRLGLFFMSFFAGVIMLFLSFSFLSLLFLGAASKFTLSYAAANVCFLLSSSFLTGPQAQLTSMFHSSRVVVSAMYLLSLFGLMFAAWQVRVFYVVIPLCAVQVVCLLLYVMSYLPFGLPVMKRLFGVFWASMSKVLGG